jgi:hypothetical protein
MKETRDEKGRIIITLDSSDEELSMISSNPLPQFITDTDVLRIIMID